MSESNERKSHQCIDCGARSPETDTNYTLISARHGWRLNRRVENDGTLTLEWRCPGCWTKYKRARPLLSTPLDGMPAARGPLGSWPDEPPSSTRHVPATVEPRPPSSRDPSSRKR